MGRNADTIRAFVAAFNAHSPEQIVKCYHPDAQILYPHKGPQLPADHAEGERNMFAAVPNYKIEPISILEADDDHAVLEIRLQGTQREDLGGKSFNVTGAYIFKMRDGLIQEERAYPDLQGLRRQLNPK